MADEYTVSGTPEGVELDDEVLEDVAGGLASTNNNNNNNSSVEPAS